MDGAIVIKCNGLPYCHNAWVDEHADCFAAALANANKFGWRGEFGAEKTYCPNCKPKLQLIEKPTSWVRCSYFACPCKCEWDGLRNSEAMKEEARRFGWHFSSETGLRCPSHGPCKQLVDAEYVKMTAKQSIKNFAFALQSNLGNGIVGTFCPNDVIRAINKTREEF